jgi:hypothetical protein
VLGGSERKVAEGFIHQVGFLQVRRTPKPVDFFGDTIASSGPSPSPGANADDTDGPPQQQRRSSWRRDQERASDRSGNRVKNKRGRAQASGEDDNTMLKLILKTKNTNARAASGSDTNSDEGDEVIFAPVARVAKQQQQVQKNEAGRCRDSGNKLVLKVKKMHQKKRNRSSKLDQLVRPDSIDRHRDMSTPQKKKSKKHKESHARSDREQQQEQEQDMLIGNLSPQSTRSNDTAMTPTFNRSRGGRGGDLEWESNRAASPLTPTWSGGDRNRHNMCGADTADTETDGGLTPRQPLTTTTMSNKTKKLLHSPALLLLNVGRTSGALNSGSATTTPKRKPLEHSQPSGKSGEEATACKSLSLALMKASAESEVTKDSSSSSSRLERGTGNDGNQSLELKEAALRRRRRKKNKNKNKIAAGVSNANNSPVTQTAAQESFSLRRRRRREDSGEWVRGHTTVSVGVETSMKSALKRAELNAKALLRKVLEEYEHQHSSSSNNSNITSDGDVNEIQNQNDDDDDDDVRAEVSSLLRRTFKQQRHERATMAKDFMEQYRRLKQQWVSQLQHEGLLVEGAVTTPTRLFSNSFDAICRRAQPGWYTSHEAWAARRSARSGGGNDGTSGATGGSGSYYQSIDQVAVQGATRHARVCASELLRNQNLESRALNAQQKSALLEVLEDYRVRDPKVCTLACAGVPLLFPTLELAGPTLVAPDDEDF